MRVSEGDLDADAPLEYPYHRAAVTRHTEWEHSCLDKRSFRLNFEITRVFAVAGFARAIADMLERD